jgi:hypothetical protein
MYWYLVTVLRAKHWGVALQSSDGSIYQNLVPFFPRCWKTSFRTNSCQSQFILTTIYCPNEQGSVLCFGSSYTHLTYRVGDCVWHDEENTCRDPCVQPLKLSTVITQTFCVDAEPICLGEFSVSYFLQPYERSFFGWQLQTLEQLNWMYYFNLFITLKNTQQYNI